MTIRSADSSETAVTGHLLVAEGFPHGGNVSFDTASAPTWPPTQHTSTAATVHLGTPIRPRAVNVKVFPAVPSGVGAPEGRPVADLDWWLEELDSARCGLRMEQDGLTLRMPRLHDGSYSVVIYIAWPNVQAADINTTSASWLFSLTIGN